jgi:hypothetical protein
MLGGHQHRRLDVERSTDRGADAAVRRWILLGALAWVLAVPTAVQAKDVCVRTQNGRWVFHKVKPMKKKGSTVPLRGVYFEAGEPAPFTGTAYVRQDGQVVFGIFAHGLAPSNENIIRDVSMTFVGDAAFAASGRIDYDGDGATDGNYTWEVVDCDTLVLP